MFLIAGYRFFKAVMFLSGLLTASLLTYVLLTEHDVLSLAGNIGVAVGAGLVCGIISMLVQYIGLFITGFHFGISFSVAIFIVLEQFYHPMIMWIPIGVTGGLGLVFGLLTLKFQKGLTILGTSVFGGALMLSCLDYFIEHFNGIIYAWERVKGVNSSGVCWYSIVILSCWPFCFLVGCITQSQITGKGFDHKEGMTIFVC